MECLLHVCIMYRYRYYVIITFYYKVRFKKKKNSRVSDWLIVQAFDWLSRHLVYYLCMDECACVGQQLIKCQWVDSCHLVKNIFI